MSTPSPNRTIAEKLDSLVTVPPQHAFDATAMWSQLEQRLPKEKSKRPVYQYLAAAAAIFIAILGTIILIEVAGPKNRTGARCLDMTIVRDFNASIKIKHAIPGSIPTRQIASATRHSKTGIDTVVNKRILKIVPMESPSAPSANNPNLLVLTKEPGMPSPGNEHALVNNSIIQDTTVLTTATAAPKKKLKVVHLNESASQDIIDATASKDGGFKVNFNTKNIESTGSGTSPFRYSIPLKAKSL